MKEFVGLFFGTQQMVSYINFINKALWIVASVITFFMIVMPVALVCYGFTYAVGVYVNFVLAVALGG